MFTVWIPLAGRASDFQAPPDVPTRVFASAMAAEAALWDADSEARRDELALDDTMMPRQVFVQAGNSRIVVVDHNADMRTYLERLLGTYWTVFALSDAPSALAAMRNQAADLVLADVMLPGVDGFALLQTIRADPVLKPTPVVLMTARAGEDCAVDGLLAGADDYVVKPFAAGELVARVSAQLELSRIRAEAARTDEFRMSVVEALRALENGEEIDHTLPAMLRDHLHCSDVVFRAGSGPAGIAAASAVIDDVDVDAGLAEVVRARYADAGVAAVVEIPVTRDGRAVGAVEVRSATPRHWSPDEVHLIEETADRTWEAVQRAGAAPASGAIPSPIPP